MGNIESSLAEYDTIEDLEHEINELHNSEVITEAEFLAITHLIHLYRYSSTEAFWRAKVLRLIKN